VTDEITLTIPRDREYHRVAHLVLGGLALRLDLTIEMLEDMQIALDALLNASAVDGDVTVALSNHDGLLETRVAPVDVGSLDGGSDSDLDLRRVLMAVADDVEVEGDSVRLLKRVGASG